MKRILIGDDRDSLISTLETILRHWGYRVLATSRADRFHDLLREISPDLMIVGTPLLKAGGSSLSAAICDAKQAAARPVVVLASEATEAPLPCPHDTLALPLDLFALFALTQQHLEEVPRQNLRLAIRLPGMLVHGTTSRLAEVLSLSTQGLFLRTDLRIDSEERLRVLFPLLGMKKEIELEGRVLYQVAPTPENNYLQGIGLQFVDLPPEIAADLEAFIAERCCGDLQETRWGRDGLNRKELRNDRPQSPEKS